MSGIIISALDLRENGDTDVKTRYLLLVEKIVELGWGGKNVIFVLGKVKFYLHLLRFAHERATQAPHLSLPGGWHG